MNGPSSLQTCSADWILPVEGEAFPNGMLVFQGGQIVSLGPSNDLPSERKLKRAIVPGLVNAHTHLEFSLLREPLGTPGMAFVEWLSLVIAERRRRLAQPNETQAALHSGLQESLAVGVTTIGEIATFGWDEMDAPTANVTLFHEVIGLDRANFAQQITQLRSQLSSRKSQRITHGVSPHAPYTVADYQLQELVALARALNSPLAMHMAESAAEMELLASGQGALVELLQSRGLWQDVLAPSSGNRARTILQLLSSAASVVVHGNYLQSADLAGLPRGVIFCPRTHAYFGHPRYPLEAFLQAGINVALGTDSRASNPDLNLWHEMRFVRQSFPSVLAAEVLAMATLRGAVALGQQKSVGSLVPGKQADFVVVQLPPAPTDPYEALFSPQAKVLQTWVGGEQVYQAAE